MNPKGTGEKKSRDEQRDSQRDRISAELPYFFGNQGRSSVMELKSGTKFILKVQSILFYFIYFKASAFYSKFCTLLYISTVFV